MEIDDLNLEFGHDKHMEQTIFSKIIAGDIPCHKVYEDREVLAFLDINPLCIGHTLVIPKEPVERLDEMTADQGSAIGRVLPKIAAAVLKATGAKAYNILQNNGPEAHQAVMHVHFHVIPKYADGQGLGIGWQPTELKEPEVLATKIKTHLQT